MSSANNSSLAYVRHGTERFPVVARPHCKTCASKRRAKIERLLIDGLTPRQIIARLPEDHGTSEQSIYRHFRRGHLPVNNRMVKRRQEIRAQLRWAELGLDATVFMAEEAELAELLVRLITERLGKGLVDLTARDLLRAAEFLHRIEQQDREHEREVTTGKTRLDLAYGHMHRVFEIVGETFGVDAQHEIVRAACRDDQASTIMLADDFADLRKAYLDDEIRRDIEAARKQEVSNRRHLEQAVA